MNRHMTTEQKRVFAAGKEESGMIETEIQDAIKRRENFIQTLRETIEIAESSGQQMAAAILMSLAAAMLTGDELEMGKAVREFSIQQLAKIRSAA